VLLIGNSQLGLNPPDVAEGLEAMSRVAFGGSNVLVVDRFQLFGAGCQGFQNAGALNAITPNTYDVVILLPSIGETRANEACWNRFRDAAFAAGADFGVMATADVRFAFPAGFHSLHTNLGGYAAAQDLMFVPAGDAWLRYLAAHPNVDRKVLYAGDSEHPGAEGDLLYVYALYGALARRSTVGMPADVVALRCAAANIADGSCLDRAELDACVDNNNFNSCDSAIVNRSPGNGMHFGPNDGGGGQVAFVTDAESAAYQAAVDAALRAAGTLAP
jgi:hypothetical protein